MSLQKVMIPRKEERLVKKSEGKWQKGWSVNRLLWSKTLKDYIFKEGSKPRINIINECMYERSNVWVNAQVKERTQIEKSKKG